MFCMSTKAQTPVEKLTKDTLHPVLPSSTVPARQALQWS